jgi:hypothetical protein
VKLVGNQGPTLHIIKSEHDHIFGGCAFEKYPNRKNGNNENKQDDKAFLFQLHPNQVMLKNTLHASNKSYAIRCYSNYLSLFGGGPDLVIFETSNPNKCYSTLGGTYELPQGYNRE